MHKVQLFFVTLKRHIVLVCFIPVIDGVFCFKPTIYKRILCALNDSVNFGCQTFKDFTLIGWKIV